jgi:hypothetical protein
MRVNSSFVVNKPCIQIVGQTSRRLAEAGLRIVQTFDLQDARRAHGDCACPHHGSAHCDCQMVVLLIYAEGLQPVSLVAHGNESKTWLALVEAPQYTRNPGLEAIFQNVFSDLQGESLIKLSTMNKTSHTEERSDEASQF